MIWSNITLTFYLFCYYWPQYLFSNYGWGSNICGCDLPLIELFNISNVKFVQIYFSLNWFYTILIVIDLGQDLFCSIIDRARMRGYLLGGARLEGSWIYWSQVLCCMGISLNVDMKFARFLVRYYHHRDLESGVNCSFIVY